MQLLREDKDKCIDDLKQQLDIAKAIRAEIKDTLWRDDMGLLPDDVDFDSPWKDASDDIPGLKKRISELEQQLAKCREDSFGAGWEAGRDSCSVTGDWTGDYEEWLKEK